MQLFEVVFSTFGGQKNLKKKNNNILVSALESYMKSPLYKKKFAHKKLKKVEKIG